MSDTNWAFTFSATESGVRRWDLRGPAGVVRFQTIDVPAGRFSSVFLHVANPPAGTDPDDIEDCEVCGKGWHDALVNSLARELRAEWEAAGCDDEVIRRRLERWYNEELSTPVPVSEGSQVSGEVGPASGVVAGSNQAATGAGNGGVVPVPVAAQPWDPTSPQHAVIRAAIAWRSTLELIGKQHPVDAVMAASDAAAALIQAVDSLPHIGEREPEPAWGSGPLVDHNLETPGTGSAYPAKYGYCAQCGAEPGQSCHYMFGDDEHEPNSVRPEPHFYRDSPGDDPNWRNLSAYKGSGTGSADPDGGVR